MPVYSNFTQAELDEEYNVRAGIPDYQEIFAQQVRETMERRAAGLKPPAWAAAAFEAGVKKSNEEEQDGARAA